jgi:hypothetical protein
MIYMAAAVSKILCSLIQGSKCFTLEQLASSREPVKYVNMSIAELIS